jgi:DNA topoisomerase-1
MASKPEILKKTRKPAAKTKKKPAKRSKSGKSSKKSPGELKKLVIVESPSKATTIKKYLGRKYEVLASVGHVIDLPKSRMGVNLETFEPDYIVMRDKYKVLKELRAQALRSSEIILASDPDREGEAIAWHIRNDFNKTVLPKVTDRPLPIRRVKFTEITQKEIEAQIQNVHEIDEKLVDAQQGRRVIDRIFGYQLSPLLWKKVKSKLSAGRVQSVALRIICEREAEIEKFIPMEYWDISAEFHKGKTKFEAELAKINGKKAEVRSAAEAQEIETALRKGKSSVKDIRTKRVSRNPSAPFITSTLQQTANNMLGYPSMKTMLIAQQLYEGVLIGSGRTGLITYMRTDSVRISPQALDQVRGYIADKYGKEYVPEKPNFYSNKKSSQDAHEAIRPSYVEYHPDEIKSYLTPEQYKVYSLIWKRFVSSQMRPAETDQRTVEIENGNLLLTTTTTKTAFDGFQKAWDLGKTAREKEVPATIAAGDALELGTITKDQKFTEPPARYTDASIVKVMEELGIGRPSTYAPTIFTITKRFYVKKEGRSLVPTVLGKAVNRLLVNNFPTLVNTDFTAKMEEELDEVEDGNKSWKGAVRDFYAEFEGVLKKAYDNIESIKGSFDEKTDIVCDVCGKSMVKKLGKYGMFLACTGWPECRNTKPIPLGKCPQCETGYVVQKKGGRGRVFYGCSSYPACDFASYQKPAEEENNPISCPTCGSVLFLQKEAGRTKLVCLKKGCGYETMRE